MQEGQRGELHRLVERRRGERGVEGEERGAPWTRALAIGSWPTAGAPKPRVSSHALRASRLDEVGASERAAMKNCEAARGRASQLCAAWHSLAARVRPVYRSHSLARWWKAAHLGRRKVGGRVVVARQRGRGVREGSRARRRASLPPRHGCRALAGWVLRRGGPSPSRRDRLLSLVSARFYRSNLAAE